MAARLGNVLYWLACVLALLCIAGAFAAMASDPAMRNEPGIILGLFGGAAIIVWLIGRACRYILAGR